MTDEREEAKQVLKIRYKDKTGEELPEHVIENLGLLTGTSLLELVEYRSNEKLADEKYRGF